MIAEMKQLFETADLVKFAKFTVPLNENDMNLVNALEFVNKTKEDDKKPKKTEAEKQMTLWRRIYKVLITILVLGGTALTIFVGWQILNLL